MLLLLVALLVLAYVALAFLPTIPALAAMAALSAGTLFGVALIPAKAAIEWVGVDQGELMAGAFILCQFLLFFVIFSKGHFDDQVGVLGGLLRVARTSVWIASCLLILWYLIVCARPVAAFVVGEPTSRRAIIVLFVPVAAVILAANYWLHLIINRTLDRWHPVNPA